MSFRNFFANFLGHLSDAVSDELNSDPLRRAEVDLLTIDTSTIDATTLDPGVTDPALIAHLDGDDLEKFN